MRAGNWFGHYAATIQTWRILPALFWREGRLLVECGPEFESGRKVVYGTATLSGGTEKEGNESAIDCRRCVVIGCDGGHLFGPNGAKRVRCGATSTGGNSCQR